MKALRKIIADVAELELNFQHDLEALADELEPLPPDRDIANLELAWRQASSARRRLATCIKEGLRQINAHKETTSVGLRRLRAWRKDLTKANTLLRHWGQFNGIVTAQIKAERRALIDGSFNAPRETEVMDQIIGLFLESMHRVANPNANSQGDDANSYGCHMDIPLPMGQFSKMIGAAHRLCLAQRKDHPLRFLDVGSGGGTKVLAAQTCFDQCDGLEYEPAVVESGQKLLGLLAPDRCRLFHGDALSFGDYATYDVIYFYRPLIGFDKMVALETQVLDQVRPGTILLVAGGFFTPDLKARNVHEMAEQVFVAGLSKPKADALREAAETMGKMVRGHGRKPGGNLGYWEKLSEVSRRNGYYI